MEHSEQAHRECTVFRTLDVVGHQLLRHVYLEERVYCEDNVIHEHVDVDVHRFSQIVSLPYSF